MTDAGGSGAPPGDAASFDVRRLGDGRRRPAAMLMAWLVGLGALVALGLAGRDAPAVGAPGGTALPPLPSLVAGEPTPGSFAAAPTPILVVADGSPRPNGWRSRVSSGPGPVSLQVVRTAASMFVHGDIEVDDVVWVFVSVQSGDGRIAGWTSLSFPGSVGRVDGAGPAMRFDVELVIPADMLDGPLWAQANVYDARGQQVATTRLEVPIPSPREDDR